MIEFLSSSPELCFFNDSVAVCSHSDFSRQSGLVVRTDRVQRIETDTYHRHEDFFALYIVRRGRGLHVINDQPFAVARGDVYVMACGTTHAYTRFEDLDLEAVYFRPDALEPEDWSSLEQESDFIANWKRGAAGRWLHLGPDESHAVFASLNALRTEWVRNSPASLIATRGLLFRHLLTLARLNSQTNLIMPTRNSGEPALAIADAVRFIDRHFKEQVRVDDLAHRFGYSSDRFTHVFALEMGRPPRDYIRHVRIERAKSLLVSTGLPVADIGFETGFPEPAYFARVFRQATGITPLKYRQLG